MINTGQMMLVVAAFSMFASLGMSVMRTRIENDRLMAESQAAAEALRIASSKVDAALAGGFSALTPGTTTESESRLWGAFACTTRVDYVTEANPDSAVGGPTNLKRVRVSVGQTALSFPVMLGALSGEY